VKNIPSVQDSSTGARHSPAILGNFLATKAEGMTVKSKKKKHTKKYYEDIQKAKDQIKVAEQGMKQMDQEVKDFHNHMANSMSGLMKAFNDGFAALDKAKKEEVPEGAKPNA
jgi:1,4-alpha-glucan branching enzyme